jgi:hypothetical protein
VRELSAPRFDKPEALASTLQPGNIITGDVDDELAALVEAAGAEVVRPAQHRVVALAAIGRQRLDAGRADDPTTLVPLYLRGPAIGPQRAAR